MARVLIVDDSATIRLTLELILNKRHKPLTAVNGKEALDKLHYNIVDIIVTDIDMPVMGGYELLRHLRADDRYRLLPVIMLTQSSDPADQIQAKVSGANWYLSKPVSSNELLDIINRFLPQNADVTKPLPPLPPIDRVALLSMGHDAGEIDLFLAKVLPMFNQEAKQALKTLKNAIKAGSMVEVSQISYNLRSSCGSLGASRLEQLCFDMSMAARRGVTDGMLMKLIEIQVEVDRINTYTRTHYPETYATI